MMREWRPKKVKKLKLYVWFGVLADYTGGVAFALAADELSARKLIIAKEPCIATDASFNAESPEVYDGEVGCAVWGGG